MGDAKPDNILIHTATNDCWLIDFGGSWTDGWVDEKLGESVAGDQQGVMKIMAFLNA
jgi:hypothetical protein